MEYTPPLTRSGTTFELDTAHELSDLPPLWAIPNLLPCHRLSLIVAPSGTGLTHLACSLAASVAPALPQLIDPQSTLPTADTASPDDHSADASLHSSPHPSILLITDRDNPDVLKPRLAALGADLHQVLILSKVYHHHPSPDGYKPPMDTAEPFSAMDHNELSELLHEHRGIRLVLIDNAELLFSQYNRPSRSRIQRQLSLLQAVANKREVAIVLLTSIPRLCNDPFKGAILSTFRDTCRMVYLLAPDLDDPSAHILFNLKNTLSAPIPNLQLHLFGPNTSPSCSFLSQVSDLKSSSATTLTYPHYLHKHRRQATRGGGRGPDPLAHDYACEVLIELLSAGPMRAGHEDDPDPNTLYQQTRLAGVRWRTAQRAKKALQIPARKEGANWYWQLPATIPNQACFVPSPLGDGQGGGSSLLNDAPHPHDETWRSCPAEAAQVLAPPAPTAQKDICATPANPPSIPTTESSSRSPSRLRDFAVAVASPEQQPGVAA